MNSFKPSSAVDGSSTAKSCPSLNIHNILNPVQTNTSGGASQRWHDPRFDSSQVDWTNSPPGQAQTGISNHGSSQRSRPQATALHAASLSRCGSPETTKAQQYPYTVRKVDTMEPRPFPVTPVSTCSINARISSIEALHSAYSQDPIRYTSQTLSNHNSHLSVAPRDGIAAPQQSSVTYQAATHSASYPIPHDTFDSQAPNSDLFQTPDGPTQIPVDKESGSRASYEKRKYGAAAAVRSRQRRKEKELENVRTITKLEQRVRELTKSNELYREERDRLQGLLTPSSGFSDQS